MSVFIHRRVLCAKILCRMRERLNCFPWVSIFYGYVIYEYIELVRAFFHVFLYGVESLIIKDREKKNIDEFEM